MASAVGGVIGRVIGRLLPTLSATRGLLGSGARESCLKALMSAARAIYQRLGETAEYTMNVSVSVIAMDGYMQRPQLLPACVSGLALVASIVACALMYACMWIRARRRRRENELVVRIAEAASANDEWENEIENQHVRRAAETDEEEEEEAVRR